MSTYTYYLSNEPPPRRRIPGWVWAAMGLLLGAGIVAGVAAAVVAYPRAAAMLWPPAPPPAWLAAIANATDPTADTIYLVDTSESMRDELPNVRQGLSASFAAKSPASQIRIIAFGDICDDLPLLDAALAETVVSSIGRETGDTETAASCTLEQTLSELKTDLAPGQPTEVFLFSDGSLPTLLDPQCAGGSPVPTTHTLDDQPLYQCHAGQWNYQPRPIIADLRAANIKIHGIYFQPHRYDWGHQVRLLATATEGEFVRVR